MLLFSERGYYPVRTIYRSASADVFLCRKLREDGFYTVNRIKAGDIISFCLTDGSRPYEDFIESFLWEQEYFIVYRWHKGETLRQYAARNPQEIAGFMEALCKKILTCGLHPALIVQLLEEDCICVREGKIFFNCFFRFPLCWAEAKEADLPGKAKELLEVCIKTSVKKEKVLLLLLWKTRKDLKKQFERGTFSEMLSLYLYMKSAAAAYEYKSFMTLKKEYQDKLKAAAERIKPYIAAATAVLAIVAVYLNWIAGLQEGRP